MTRLTPADLNRPLAEIAAERYEQGRLERGREPGEQFIGDPLLEALEELADFHAYLTETIRQRKACGDLRIALLIWCQEFAGAMWSRLGREVEQ